MQPPVLAEADRYAAAFPAMPSFTDAITDPQVHAEVLRAIPRRPPAVAAKAAAQARLVARAAADGPDALTTADRLRLLGDAEALIALRSRLLEAPAPGHWPVCQVAVEAEVAALSVLPADESAIAAHDSPLPVD